MQTTKKAFENWENVFLNNGPFDFLIILIRSRNSYANFGQRIV